MSIVVGKKKFVKSLKVFILVNMFWKDFESFPTFKDTPLSYVLISFKENMHIEERI